MPDAPNARHVGGPGITRAPRHEHAEMIAPSIHTAIDVRVIHGVRRNAPVTRTPAGWSSWKEAGTMASM